MKNTARHFLFLTTLASTLSPALAAPPNPVTYNPDDLFLAFRATGGNGGTFDYLVNIGQASLYRDATSSFTIAGLGDIKADLDYVFGATWNTRLDVLWSVSGTPGAAAVGSDPLRTLYATKPENPVGTQSTAWLRSNSAGQSTPANKIAAVGGGYVQNGAIPNTSTANSPVGVIQNTGDVNSYASFQLGGTGTTIGTAYSYFSNGIEGNFGNGTAGTALDLYRVVFAGGANGGSIGNPGQFLGTFHIDDLAAVTFVVPEPSTLSILLFGTAYLALRRRRSLASV